MACKARRRRHNKHNLSMLNSINSKGEPAQVPVSRKAFKWLMRQFNITASKDLITIKNKVKELEIGEAVYITNEKLFTAANAGYWTRNSKGPVKLEGELLDKYLKMKAAQKTEKAEMRAVAYGK